MNIVKAADFFSYRFLAPEITGNACDSVPTIQIFSQFFKCIFPAAISGILDCLLCVYGFSSENVMFIILAASVRGRLSVVF